MTRSEPISQKLFTIMADATGVYRQLSSKRCICQTPPILKRQYFLLQAEDINWNLIRSYHHADTVGIRVIMCKCKEYRGGRKLSKVFRLAVNKDVGAFINNQVEVVMAIADVLWQLK